MIGEYFLKGGVVLSLFSRVLSTIRHHWKSSVLLYFYYLFALCSTLLLSYFTFYLFLSKKLIKNTIIAIKEHDTIFYAEPFEELRKIVERLLTNAQKYFLLFVVISAFSIILLQIFLFYLRKKEYRTYLLLNAQKKTLSHQIAIEQLILLNAALVTLTLLFLFLQTILTNFFADMEIRMVKQYDPHLVKMSIDSLPGNNSILNQTGFTRFHIKPFLIDSAKMKQLKPIMWQRIPFIFTLINSCSYLLIYLTNYILLRVKKLLHLT